MTPRYDGGRGGGRVLIRSGAYDGPLHRRAGPRCCYSPAVDINHVDMQIYSIELEVEDSKHESRRAGKADGT